MTMPSQDGDEEAEIVIPEIDESMIEQMLFITFVVNHRALYDFFDEKGYKVFLVAAEEGQFTAELDGEKMAEVFKTRTDAEQAVFKKAIDKIENQ